MQPALCFLSKKFGKCDENRLKTVLSNFYTSDVINSAKTRLVEDIEREKIDGIPSNILVSRRDNKERCMHDINDMISIVRILDERLLLDKLPLYVADDPLKLPSLGISDGDIYVVLGKLAQLENAMSVLQSNMNGIYNLLYTGCRPAYPPTCLQPFVAGHTSSVDRSVPGVHTSGSQQPAAVLSLANKNNNTGNSEKFIDESNAGAANIPLNNNGISTAPNEHIVNSSNRWSALMDYQSHSDYEASGEEALPPFSTVLSRSARRAIARANKQHTDHSEKRDKRRRECSPPAPVPSNHPDGHPQFQETTHEKTIQQRKSVYSCLVVSQLIDQQMTIAQTMKHSASLLLDRA